MSPDLKSQDHNASYDNVIRLLCDGWYFTHMWKSIASANIEIKELNIMLGLLGLRI